MDSARLRRVGRLGIAAPVAVTLFASLVACGSSGSKPADSSSSTSKAAGGAAPADLKTVTVVVSASGCGADYDSFNTGALTFNVSNKDATAVSEFEVLSDDRILGEKENLAPGLKGTFSLEMQPGTYTLYCPGASTEKKTFTITGTASTTAGSSTKSLLLTGAKQYQSYVELQIQNLTEAVTPLVTAIKGNDLAAAQAAYAKARPYYERIEPVAESFPDLDPAIDARADDVAPTKLTGFHRIEYGLFQVKSTAGLSTIADQLVTDIGKLKAQTLKLNGFQPAELANGAVGLLDEAAKSKITGEEERYSHIDLLDFSANVEGAEQAFAYLEEGMNKIDPALVTTIKAAFVKLETLLDTYKDSTQPSGYKLYTALTAADKTGLTQALTAVSEPLSRVAGKVVTA